MSTQFTGDDQVHFKHDEKQQEKQPLDQEKKSRNLDGVILIQDFFELLQTNKTI